MPGSASLENLPAFDENLVMNSEEALAVQIARYRQMTGEERLMVALELHDLSCEIAREGIRRQYPNADESEVELKLRQRLALWGSSERA